jgi:hypothetical protein
MKKHALAFGISMGLTLLTIAAMLLVYAPDQTSYVLTMVGLLCSCISMFLISADVLKNKPVAKE